jgi:hypothetical protein
MPLPVSDQPLNEVLTKNRHLSPIEPLGLRPGNDGIGHLRPIGFREPRDPGGGPPLSKSSRPTGGL